jgi:hypothetical protein
MKKLYYWTSTTSPGKTIIGPHDRLTNTHNITGNCTYIRGNAQNLTGDVKGLVGEISGLSGDASNAVIYTSGDLYIGDITNITFIDETTGNTINIPSPEIT